MDENVAHTMDHIEQLISGSHYSYIHKVTADHFNAWQYIACIQMCIRTYICTHAYIRTHYTTFALRCASMKPFKIKAIKTYVKHVTHS